MVKTVTLTEDIAADRELHVTLPPDTPLGPADIVVVIVPRAAAAAQTVDALLDPEFFGMWKDRDDIEDSSAFARSLRDTAWRRLE